MTAKPDNPRREIFLEAAEIDDPWARAAYLDTACGGDGELRRRVEALLVAEAEAGPPPEVPSPAPVQGDPAVGSRIDGRYKLLQQIGEGGCGVVYMAEQQAPIRRKVALKIIKLGMDTKQVVDRFEAERQALAMMDHPNIAKVFDAGAMDTGRPYFVMELVRGIKITNYCDEHQLPTSQRLDLFMQVCHAVQHAHQKGIIHRDLKPSNVLVTEMDGKPLPKVIDFGIAKAVSGRLTDNTLFTAFEQLVGTPSYMSPEQASLASADIDTRTDIYSLGVMLYQLLTGETPFDTKALLAAGLDEMRRTISERVPARPSNRLTTMAPDQVKAVAWARGSEPSRFMHVLAGDLDWVVMKCLEKDRRRRYQTVNGLAMDIQRHLNNEPVVARPPSRLYEFQKTARRHWVGFAATSAVIFVLAAGIVATSWQAVRATRAEREQIQLRTDAVTALKALRGDRPSLEVDFASNSNALVEIEQALQRWPDQPRLWANQAFLLEQVGRFDDASRGITRAIQLLETEPGASDGLVNEFLVTRHRLWIKNGRIAEAAIDNCRARGIPLRDPNTPGTLIDLGAFYDAPLTESLHMQRGLLGNDLTGLMPAGIKELGGRLYDVRGIISLRGSMLISSSYPFPRQVSGIPVGLEFSRLHCLIITGWSEPDGTEIGSFVLHYQDGQTKQCPILYGVHARDLVGGQPSLVEDGGNAPLEHGQVVWTGSNLIARDLKGYLRLYAATWDNPRPDEQVVSIDFTSEVTRCAPSMLAMTVEP